MTPSREQGAGTIITVMFHSVSYLLVAEAVMGLAY